jgi:Leucine-rich repeat (LRR) protein
MKTQILFFFCFFFGSAVVWAQGNLLSSKELATTEVYTSLKKASKNPEKVYRLDLSFQQLTEFPKEILLFKNLQVLDLQGNKIKELPEELGTLSNLQKLNLKGNRLETISISKLKYLEDLNLSENKAIKSLPQGFENLINLVDLDLSRCSLTELPKEIGVLIKLKTLNLYKNQLLTIPAEIGQLSSLQDLNLGENKTFTIFPKEIESLKSSLKDLNLEETTFGLSEDKKQNLKQVLPNTQIVF